MTTPFLTKLYELVSDSFTDDLVSWEKNGRSFVIHKPNEFCFVILPHYFKHNNFSSFVRQLNQYGFRKLHPDEWIFGHEYFKWGRRDSLVYITRKKTRSLDFSSLFIDKYRSEKIEKEIRCFRSYRYYFAKDMLDICRRQEKFLLNQKYLESTQRKLEMELNHLKSFIFGYVSRVISSEHKLELCSRCCCFEKYFSTRIGILSTRIHLQLNCLE